MKKIYEVKVRHNKKIAEKKVLSQHVKKFATNNETKMKWSKKIVAESVKKKMKKITKTIKI